MKFVKFASIALAVAAIAAPVLHPQDVVNPVPQVARDVVNPVPQAGKDVVNPVPQAGRDVVNPVPQAA